MKPNKLLSWIKNNLDKSCHFLVCTLIVIVVCGLMNNLIGISFIISLIVSIIITIIIGVGKEWFDKLTGGVFDKMDLLADLCGCLFGILLSILIL